MFLMRVFAFEFLLGLACMGLFFATPARAGYFCSAEAERGGIQYSDSAGIQWEVTNLRFEKTPFLGSYLSCAQLLDQVGDRINASTALTKLYPDEKHMARFRARDPLIDLCLQSPACRLDPLQNWFLPGLLWKSLRRPDLFESHPHCRNPVSQELDLDEDTETGPGERMSFPTLQTGQVWNIPEESLVQRIFEQIEKKNPERILMTSMIFSKTILRRLDDWLLRHPGKEAWVFFAYNLHVMESGFPEEYAPRSKGLYLVPIFQTPETEDSYHIKGIGFGGRDPSIHLMTVNIRMFREEKVADVITELKGHSAYRSFESLLGRVLDHQCKRRSFLDCSNLLRYPSGDSRANRIRTWVDRACENRQNWTAPGDPSFFSRGGDGVVEATLLEEIGRARTQIDLASHVFNRSKVSDALLEAAVRGVKVRVLVGTPIQDAGFQKVLEKSVDLKLQTRKEGVTAHAKFAVMDGARAIWGTGNLTKTSLQNPWEIFLGTQDVKFLKSLNDYFNRFHRSGENPRDPSQRPRPIGDWFEK